MKNQEDDVEVRMLKDALVKATRARWEAEDEVKRLQRRVAELRAAEVTTNGSKVRLNDSAHSTQIER